ncbi:MAG: RHS repeat-associated core domain-containing protein, partial [Chloroflexi bacterium]|nr:RHS repeat-associated core domain-containing protein [Chloroflexota bacterium]
MYRDTAYIANYVERKVSAESVVYVGNLYEKNVTTQEVTKYYYAEGRRIAMRKGSNVYYLLADHLGSTVTVLDASGGNPRNSFFWSFGGSRLSPSSPATDKLYTGQQADPTVLYFYQARWYDSAVGRFVSPDTIVPDLSNPRALNRYSYAYNNPVRYNDPTGHEVSFNNPWRDREIKIDDWPDWAKSLAVGGCFLVGCQVDTTQGVIRGPSDKEYAEAAATQLINPLGMASGPGPRQGLIRAVQGLAESRGWQGNAARLTSALERGAAGAAFQAQRTLYYASEVLGIEFREVFGGRAGYLDILLTGNRVVDPKNWTGWARHSVAEQDQMLGSLRAQARKYLSNAEYTLKFEFKESIPTPVLDTLKQLGEEFGG